MKRLLFLLLITNIIQVSAQTTYVNNGTNISYTLAAGDSLYIASGTYTGSVNCWVANTKITVAAGAHFRPSSVNGYRSILRVYGTATLPNVGTGDGFQLYNYGNTTFTGNPQINSTATIVNDRDATLSLSGLAINAVTSFTNDGQIIVNGNLNVNGNATIQNNSTISIAGNFNASGGTLNNQGLFLATGSITMSSSAVLNNSCRTVAQNGITFYNNVVYNSGLIWASSTGNASFVNHSTLTSNGNGVIKSGTFTNYGHIRGNGNIYVTGKSTLGGGASVGSNSSIDQLRIYTVNRTSTSKIFDDQWGTVYSNATYSAIAAPDTLTPGGYGCSFEYAPYIILPVEWSEFTVSLTNNTPALQWAILNEEKIVFEVERSTNGKDFEIIAKLGGTSFRDVSAAEAGTLYYRVKAITADGTQKYSSIETVRTANTDVASYQVFPNPFLQKVTVQYKSNSRNAIVVKVFNAFGQIQYQKKTETIKGYNQIEINETSTWKTGIYVIQITGENGDVQSMKVMKQ